MWPKEETMLQITLTNNGKIAGQRLFSDTVLDHGLPFAGISFLDVEVLDLVESLQYDSTSALIQI